VPPPEDLLRPVPAEIAVGGLVMRIAAPASAEDLIDEEDFARDERLPYWAELWPSGRVLAEALVARDLAGLTVLELGCGLALPSIVAMARGATVLATDWYEEALEFARANARSALGRDLPTLLVDWRAPPADLVDQAPFDLVLAADVLYEPRNGPALAALLPHLVADDGEVWIADPRRPDAQRLWDLLDPAGWARITEDVRLESPVDEAGPVVHLHRLRPPSAPGSQERLTASDTLGRTDGPR
jgi:predicted nicotinamide N-methyase